MVGQVDLLFMHENTSATSKVRRISPIKLTPTVTAIATPSELQKAEEFLALTRFREASDQLTGTLEPVVQDPPDFLITDGSRTASVEMTRYLQRAGKRGSPEAQREAMEMRVVARAKEIFEAAHLDVYVNVSPFFKISEIKRVDIEPYAQALAQLVWDVLPPAPSPAERLVMTRTDWDAIDRVRLGNVLANVSLHRWWPAKDAWWGSLSGMASADVTEIERTIRRKELDLGRYSVSAGERWLIIYAWFMRSAFFDREVLSAGMFTSTFDRVIFFDLPVQRFVAVA